MNEITFLLLDLLNCLLQLLHYHYFLTTQPNRNVIIINPHSVHGHSVYHSVGRPCVCNTFCFIPHSYLFSFAPPTITTTHCGSYIA